MHELRTEVYKDKNGEVIHQESWLEDDGETLRRVMDIAERQGDKRRHLPLCAALRRRAAYWRAISMQQRAAGCGIWADCMVSLAAELDNLVDDFEALSAAAARGDA